MAGGVFSQITTNNMAAAQSLRLLPRLFHFFKTPIFKYMVLQLIIELGDFCFAIKFKICYNDGKW
jgi:hypothetical protein